MAPRIPGKARLKQPGKNDVPEMANGDTSPNHPNLKKKKSNKGSFIEIELS